jgi:hypothetical protein
MTPLPDIDKTLVNLALALLSAPTEHPDLVPTQMIEAADVSPKAARMTLHYVSGLLAYGFSSQYQALEQATAWFATPFPDGVHHRVDSTEMSRLEALLYLAPTHPGIQPRLEKLLEQRTPDNQFIIQKKMTGFDTLWALKVLNLAIKSQAIDSTMNVKIHELCELIDNSMVNAVMDKDLALALNLRYELHGELTKNQERKLLHKLIKNAEANNGVWDIPRDMVWLAANMRREQLSNGDIEQNRDTFRDMILSTCYVIENLSPLRRVYPELDPILRQALELWWGVFHHEDAARNLRLMFPDPYDYLFILSRTLIMLRAYLNQPLIDWGTTYVYNRMIEQQMKPIESADKKSIKQALRGWILVDIEGEPNPLKLGLSGANVVRVKPNVRNPLFPDDENFRIAESLIIKYGPVQEISQERESYKKLPEVIKGCFVNIPNETYIDPDQQRAYVILPDLYRFKTLHEMLHNIARIRGALMRELPIFLLGMHQGGIGNWQTSPAPRGILHELYLRPMQEHVHLIFNFLWNHNLLTNSSEQKRADQLQYKLVDLIAALPRHQARLEKFPKAYMHGDLHTRNIMFRQLSLNQDAERDRELDFKLIDLEKFRADGDAAMDIGELLADMRIALATMRKTNDVTHPLSQLMRKLGRDYADFGARRNDVDFGMRVELAQARALIRITKGLTRKVEHNLQEKKPTSEIVRDMLGYCEDAVNHLQQVQEHLKRSS